MKYLFVLTALGFFACVSQEKSSYSVRHYEPSDEKVSITGRVLKADSVTIYWPGTNVKVRFSGGTLKAYLRDEKGTNYFNVVIDGDSLHYFQVDTVKRFYTLADGLG